MLRPVAGDAGAEGVMKLTRMRRGWRGVDVDAVGTVVAVRRRKRVTGGRKGLKEWKGEDCGKGILRRGGNLYIR